jgi:hypothetical protein
LFGYLWFVKPSPLEAHVVVSAAVIVSVFAICWAAGATFWTAVGVVMLIALGYAVARIREAGVDAGVRWRRSDEE